MGDGNFQNMPETERARITINGERVIEVDIHACNLTIFLALTGTRELPQGDLYTRIELPEGSPNARAAIKQWMVQTFGAGKLMSRRSWRTPEEAKGVGPSVIRNAALRAYPALANLTAILPLDLAASIPPEALHKAVGLFLTNWESRIMEGALGYVWAHGGVGLPMHDALIVPKSVERIARDALSGAFFVFLKVMPKLK